MIQLRFHKTIVLAFLLPLAFWIYLAFSSQMILIHDALAYFNFGEMMRDNNWVKFFSTGPNREPLYSLLVSISMRLSDLFSIPFQTFQKIFQLIIFFLSQFLLYKILVKLRISTLTQSIVLLYFGFSPALVNSTFCLYSEILTYPLILGTVLVSVKAWQAVITGRSWKALLGHHCLIGISFAAITLIKATFEYIFIIYMLPYLFLTIYFIFKKNTKLFRMTVLGSVVVILSFQAIICTYKFLNYKYNRQFLVADNRGAFILYGTAQRRLALPLNTKNILTGFSYIMGDNVCLSFFDENTCFLWGWVLSERLGFIKIEELDSQRLSLTQTNATIAKDTLNIILKNPFHYLFVGSIDTIKLCFWESTKMGFVEYPSWLTRLYDWKLFKNSLRLILSLLTIFSLIVCSYWGIFKNHLSPIGRTPQEPDLFLFFTVWLILSFSCLYFLFTVVNRYSLPIVPLYLITIAITLDHFILKKKAI